MRKLCCFLVSFCLIASVSAQKVYFIYLQSDNGAPFYVKMEERIHSSAASGYLVLSNLVDSTYRFAMGFPGGRSELKFSVSLGGRDRGFLIKDFEDGRGLFDLQNMNVIRPLPAPARDNISYQVRDDAFTLLLAKAAKDTTLLLVPVFARQDIAKNEVRTADNIVEEKPVSVPAPALIRDTVAADVSRNDGIINAAKVDSVFRMDSVAAPASDAVNPTAIPSDTAARTENRPEVPKESSVTGAETYRRSQVRKYAESSTSEGFGLIFHDSSADGATDTIHILIPNPLHEFRGADSAAVVVEKKPETEVIPQTEHKTDSLLAPELPIVVSVAGKQSALKANCKAVAGDNDFFKLRRNMAARNTDEDMVSEARKQFRNKCFTTEQVRNLSALFLTSAGKYLFFDAAFLHVSDQAAFGSLETELKDDYYLRRFKALVGE